MLTRTRLGAVPAAVTQVRTLSPHMTRVTLHANDFADLTYRGSDHYVRLLLPRASQVEPLLPSSAQWWPEMVAMPAEVRPILRNYTVADLRPAAAEMDIDFVCHGDTGPATRWVNRAQVGSPVGIIDQGVLHDIRDDAHEYLIVGDETALPAATGLLGVLPAGITTTVLLEVPTEADRRELAAPGASDQLPLPARSAREAGSAPGGRRPQLATQHRSRRGLGLRRIQHDDCGPPAPGEGRSRQGGHQLSRLLQVRPGAVRRLTEAVSGPGGGGTRR